VLEAMKSLGEEPITMAQRIRWVALAFVPSSLFLGVTTYLTTDIAAIPLLWVIPLALYLLSFILVFSEYGRKFLLALLGAIVLAAAVVGLKMQGGSSTAMELVMGIALLLGAGTLIIGALWGWNAIHGKDAPFALLGKRKVETVGHLILILVLPVALLLMTFMVLSGVGPKRIEIIFALHLATLFIVAMVCHGELARTRPATRYLTEFYLLMSLGGVLGGLFNALVAPVVFNRIAEYQLTMVFACLVLPNLAQETKSKWSRVLDIGLPAVLSLLAIGLILRRWIEGYIDLRVELGKINERRVALGLEPESYSFWSPVDNFFRDLGQLMNDQPMWKWYLATIILIALGYLAWAIAMDVMTKRKGMLLDRALDIATALALCVLATGIILQPPLSVRSPLIQKIATTLDMVDPAALAKDLATGQFSEDVLDALRRVVTIIIYGLPALFCYIFVERPVRFAFCLGVFLLAGSLSTDLKEQDEGDRVLRRERSFFGAIAVKREGPHHRLVHGTTLHGKQFFNSDEEMAGAFIAPLMASNPLGDVVNERIGQWMWFKRREALTYYHLQGPIGQLMTELEKRRPLPHLAVIGLGTGTMASYAEPGQKLTYYEIDPTIKRIAEDRSLFTYVADARDRGADVDIVMGDARLQLKHAPDHEYGLIVVDAFSSDAIPVHLITKEAVDLELDKLADDGILAYHISNRHLNLKPVLVNLAHEFDLAVLDQSDDSRESIGKSGSHWVLLARTPDAFGSLNKDVKRWPTDSERHWKTPVQKRSADELTDADLAQWKQAELAFRRRSDRLDDKAAEELKAKMEKWSSAETKRRIQDEIDKQWDREQEINQSVGVWTDDFSNILKVFNLSE
jgi:hypothetical protein